MGIEQLFNKRFRFKANRYEEWQAGRCVSSGDTSAEIIVAEKPYSLDFTIDGLKDIRIKKEFEFNKANSSLLQDRIQYVRSSDFDPIEPVICHLFGDNGELNCVRFAMTNPDRLVEFYGSEITTAESFNNFLFDTFLGW